MLLSVTASKQHEEAGTTTWHFQAVVPAGWQVAGVVVTPPQDHGPHIRRRASAVIDPGVAAADPDCARHQTARHTAAQRPRGRRAKHELN